MAQLERQPTAEGVADDVGALEPGRVHVALDAVGERGERGGDALGKRLTAAVAEQRHRGDVMVLPQGGDDRLPDAGGPGEAVDEDERFGGHPRTLVSSLWPRR